MELEELVNGIFTRTFDSKDEMRARDICNKAHIHIVKRNGKESYTATVDEARTILANKQLKAIKDPDKFIRRCRAFIAFGITITFKGTMCDGVTTYMNRNRFKSLMLRIRPDISEPYLNAYINYGLTYTV